MCSYLTHLTLFHLHTTPRFHAHVRPVPECTLFLFSQSPVASSLQTAASMRRPSAAFARSLRLVPCLNTVRVKVFTGGESLPTCLEHCLIIMFRCQCSEIGQILSRAGNVGPTVIRKQRIAVDTMCKTQYVFANLCLYTHI